MARLWSSALLYVHSRSHGKRREAAADCSTFTDAVMDRGERRPPIVGDGEALKHARCSTFKDAVMDRKARGGRS